MRSLRRFTICSALLPLALASAVFIDAQMTTAPVTAKPTAAQQCINLPAPEVTGGMPLMQALDSRRTTRTFADKPLSMQQISNALWAGFGVNRKVMGNDRSGQPVAGRTAPSGQNKQDIQLYVVLAQGSYVYDAVKNELDPVASGDLRTKIGGGAAAHAAATIVFVAPAKDDPFGQVDTGFIGQNIYLYAASEGLNAWFYAFHNQDVAGALNLPADKTPLYGESIGFPDK